jgi:hypothetical protein
MRGAERQRVGWPSPASERGAWLTSHGFVVHATQEEVSAI